MRDLGADEDDDDDDDDDDDENIICFEDGDGDDADDSDDADEVDDADDDDGDHDKAIIIISSKFHWKVFLSILRYSQICR